MIISLRFSGKNTSSAKAWMDVVIDIGTEENPIRIVGQTVYFGKGKDVDHDFVLTYMVYTLDTWEKNGGKFVIYPSHKDTELHDISVSITRTHASREQLGGI